MAEAFDLVDAGLGAVVPEAYDTIAAEAAELGLFHGVEGYFLDVGGVTFELGGLLDVGAFGVPDTDGTVGCYGNECTERVPVHCAETGRWLA